MKILLLFSVLVALLRGEEPTSVGLREKLHARVLESLPAGRVFGQVDPRSEPTDGIVVLEPLVISESRAVRELARSIASEERRVADERFDAVHGGTIHRNERLELGGWWSPDTGWQFLKFKW